MITRAEAYKAYTINVCAGTKAGVGLAALEPVQKSMGNPLETKTITLSCGKLTTGVTIKPWTGIFMLRNLKSPETYFQAAFRVQSPWEITTDQMEFNEKLQELRKSRSLTQEELAEALFVSRTAISKWESGRGYPSIDTLKEISRFFSITIDDLICSEEMITVAETDKKEFVSKNISLICNVLDILLAILLFIPAFGNGTASSETVTLFGLSGIAPWLRTVFVVLIGITILNGICGVIIANFNKSVWNRHRLVTGVVLSILSVTVFIVTRQPYAGIVCFAFLVIKGFLIAKAKQQ